MTKTVEFEYEWRGFILNCEAEFEGEHSPAELNPDAIGVGPAEYPELGDVTVTINNEEFDIDGIYELMPRDDLIWGTGLLPKYAETGICCYNGAFIKKDVRRVFEAISLQNMIEERANELWMEAV